MSYGYMDSVAQLGVVENATVVLGLFSGCERGMVDAGGICPPDFSLAREYLQEAARVNGEAWEVTGGDVALMPMRCQRRISPSTNFCLSKG